MGPGRKVPFSGKAKKEQLKLKRARKQLENRGEKSKIAFLQSHKNDDDSEYDNEQQSILKINTQPGSSRGKSNRYALQFYKETKQELEKRKKEAFNSLEMKDEIDLEIKIDDYFPSGIDFPRRPPWNFNMSKEELDAREHRYFNEFINGLEKQFEHEKLSYFELNLETWRQLWRVIEMSDIILIIVDIRYAPLMFPPSLYNFVCNELGKNMILVLNKIDLVPADVVVAWKHYFLNHYPTLKIITFTSYPAYNLRNNLNEKKSGLLIRRRRGKMKMAAEGAQKLLETCKEIVANQVDLSSWAEKIAAEMDNEYDDTEEVTHIITEPSDTHYEEHERYKSGTLTIGCVGQPNVGKSSLMNAIMGKKVVSVSRTPGHTKHFQTIYLTKNVILCDCPGLVFPSLIPKTLQILIGAFPIAQVREPYSAVKYLAERLDIPKLLHLKHPENDDTWSAMDICDAWSRQRGFFTAKAARPDVYRAANHILRMALEGKICLCMKPPGYVAGKEKWEKHEEVSEIKWIQAIGKVQHYEEDDEYYDSDDSVKGRNVGTVPKHPRSDGQNTETDTDENDEESEEEEYNTKTKLTNKFDLLQSGDC